MKRVYGIIFLLFLVLSLGFVFAQQVSNDEVVAGANVVGSSLRGFFEGLLSPLFAEFAIAHRLMLALLLFLILWTVVPMIFGPEYYYINIVVSVIITSLAMIAIPPEFITAIIAQYGVMGATLLSILPFIIILLFSIKVRNTLVARVIWLFYCVYYFAIYIYLTIGVFNQGGSWLWISQQTVPYFAAMVAGFFMFFFIVKIQQIVHKGTLESLKNNANRRTDLANLGVRIWAKRAEDEGRGR